MEENIPCYVTERIININELEKKINFAFLEIQLLKKELKKENPSISDINGFSESLYKSICDAKNFQFILERRKVSSNIQSEDQ